MNTTKNSLNQFNETLDPLPWHPNSFLASSKTAIFKAFWMGLTEQEAAKALQQCCKEHGFEVELGDFKDLWPEAAQEIAFSMEGGSYV